MRTIVVSRHGGPEVPTPTDWLEPEPAPEKVVIDTAAIGVNFLDATERGGGRPAPLRRVTRRPTRKRDRARGSRRLGLSRPVGKLRRVRRRTGALGRSSARND